jgi:hypothetical protein
MKPQQVLNDEQLDDLFGSMIEKEENDPFDDLIDKNQESGDDSKDDLLDQASVADILG